MTAGKRHGDLTTRLHRTSLILDQDDTRTTRHREGVMAVAATRRPQAAMYVHDLLEAEEGIGFNVVSLKDTKIEGVERGIFERRNTHQPWRESSILQCRRRRLHRAPTCCSSRRLLRNLVAVFVRNLSVGSRSLSPVGTRYTYTLIEQMNE